MAAIAYILFLKRKSKIAIVFVISGIYAVYLIVLYRGFNAETYFYLINTLSWYDFFAAFVLGEGRAVSSMQTEWRIVGMLFSLGIFGSVLIGLMLFNYMADSKYALHKKNDVHFKAGFGFIVVLFLCSFHYNVFFVFPNVFFIVMLIAFSSIGYINIREKNAQVMRQGDTIFP